MRTLIGVMTCHAAEYRRKADAQRATWVKDCIGADVKFFVGGVGDEPRADEISCECPDSYESCKQKVRLMFDWALWHGYDYVWKVDDDIYLRPERLLRIPHYDYCGVSILFETVQHRLSMGYSKPIFLSNPVHACAGPCYGLSRKSLLNVCNLTPDTLPAFWHEDVWCGLRLREFGITPTQLAGGSGAGPGLIRKPCNQGVPNGWSDQEPPHPSNNVAVSYEHTAEQMVAIHEAFKVNP